MTATATPAAQPPPSIDRIRQQVLKHLGVIPDFDHADVHLIYSNTYRVNVYASTQAGELGIIKEQKMVKSLVVGWVDNTIILK